jgi:hypothetical protein
LVETDMMDHVSLARALRALAAAALLPLAGCVSSSEPPPPGWYTETVAVADLDGDGRPDVLSATTVFTDVFLPGYLTVRRQSTLTAGAFDAPLRTTTCLDPEAVAVGDVDGDGRPDVAVACGAASGATHEVVVHLQVTSQPVTFGPPASLATGAAVPTSIRLADLDGDGRLDLVVGVSTGIALLVFFQAPAPAAPGSFAPTPAAIEVGAAPLGVAAADLTGAGRLDLVATTTAGRAVVLLHGATPGTFLPGVPYPAGVRPVAVEVADLDGDGHPDVLLADANGALLVMTQRAGGGVLDPVVAYGTRDDPSVALSVADLDGDGRLDVAVASAGPPGQPGSVAVFHQAADPAPAGTLLAPTLYTGYYGPLAVVAADLDGDGLPDLAIADGLASIRFQDPTGLFRPPVWLRQ